MGVIILKKLKIGLLPLYIKLYDDSLPEMRKRINSFYKTIVSELEKRNLQVVSTQVCRIKSEFENTVRYFEKEDVDAIVTLHLAYSPSLESAYILAASKLPLIILDTTPTFDFSPAQHPDEILYNHGIHGVQDMCNLLLRNGKSFLIEAGHWAESDVLDRVKDCVKASKLAKNIKEARVGKLGQPFYGMGDFDLPDDVMKSTIGIETITYNPNEGKKLFEEITDEQIEEEINQDSKDFISDNLNNAIYKQSTKACLSIRKWIEKNRLTAFTVNFMEITKQSGIPCMPFMEASKAMSRCVGYAGEGDVLTAALVGALLSVYSETSFTEMFCPDWKNNSIFLSHMGEMNLSLAAIKPTLKEKDFPFTDADNTVVAYSRFKGGNAVFVNLAPGKDNTYSLIISPVEMLAVEGEDRMEDSIHGWFKPTMQVSEFLSTYSKHGGTHHAAIVYGNVIKVLEDFAEIMGWKLIKIGDN
jgi:L-arabinose isomerase